MHPPTNKLMTHDPSNCAVCAVGVHCLPAFSFGFHWGCFSDIHAWAPTRMLERTSRVRHRRFRPNPPPVSETNDRTCWKLSRKIHANTKNIVSTKRVCLMSKKGAHILGKTCCKKTRCFQNSLRSCCPGSKANYSRFHRHRFRTSSILAPKMLDCFARLFKVFRPALKIEDLQTFFCENRPSWPALKSHKRCKIFKTHVSLGKMQAVHIHTLPLGTCAACPPYQIPHLGNPGSAFTSWIDD